MKKEQNIIKRYFLATAFAPFTVGCLLAMGLGMLGGWLLLIFKPALHTGMTVVPLTIGWAVLIGGINKLVCHFFVSYRRGSGLYMIVGYDPAGGKYKLTAAGNPLWGKGIWIDLPSTDRPHEVRFPRDKFPAWSEHIILKVFFRGMFDPREVYEKIVGAGYRSFDLWLQNRFLVAVAGSPVLYAFQCIRERPLNEVGKVLAGLEFSGGLENIDHTDVTPTVSVTVSFK